MKWVIGLMILLSATFAFAQTWTPQNSGTTNSLQAVDFVDNNIGWAVGNNGTILCTTNGGSGWVAQYSGTMSYLYGVAFVDASTGWAVGTAGTIRHTTNGGSTWVSQNSETSYDLYDVAFVDVNTGWAVGDRSILHTTNGGTTWANQTSGTYNQIWAVSFVDINNGWAVGGSGTIRHTTNGGTDWIAQSNGTNDELRSVTFIDVSNGWQADGGIRHTTNGGSTWVFQHGFASRPFDVTFLDTSAGWAVGGNGMILHTTNGGGNWLYQNSGTTQELSGIDLVDTNHGWAVGNGGTILRYFGCYIQVFSPNGGEQWHILQLDTVRWTSIGYGGPVSIELNRFYPSGTWEILTDSTENDGVEAFYITDPLSDHCRVRISALEDTLTDISDADFSITSSQGYLALFQAGPNTPILSWNAGLVECPYTTSVNHYCLKNFGSESIVVFQPLEPISSEFSRTITCDSLFTLAPSQTSTYLSLTFDPLNDGVYRDTLLIQTDAINAVNGYVRIPLQGQQISTPATPVTVLTLEGNNARLTWEPITESILGCPVTITAYLIFYSETYAGPFYFLNLTTDTTYVHTWVVRFAPSMFYEVIAITEPLTCLDNLIAGRNYTREEIIQIIKN